MTTEIPNSKNVINNSKNEIKLLNHYKNSQILGGLNFLDDRCFIEINEDVDYGKICELDLNDWQIKASTPRSYRVDLKEVNSRYLQTSGRDYYGFYLIDGLKGFATVDKRNKELLLLDDGYSLWAGKFNSNSTWFNSIICLNKQFKQKWQFSPKFTINGVDQFFVYPETIVLKKVVHCFFNQHGNIYHYGLELDTGRVLIKQLLFTSPFQVTFEFDNNEKAYFPKDRSPFLIHDPDEALHINLNGVAFAYMNKSNLETTNWNWKDSSLVFQKNHSIPLAKNKKTEFIILFCKPDINEDVAVLKVESEAKDQGKEQHSDSIFCYDFDTKSIIGNSPILETNNDQYVNIHIDQESQSRRSSNFLLEIVDMQNPTERVIEFFDASSAKKLWTKKIIQAGVHFINYPYIWLVKEDTDKQRLGFDVLNLDGTYFGTATVFTDFKEAWDDFQQVKKSDVLNSYLMFDMACSLRNKNEAYITTSNGYIYRWNLEGEKNK